MHTAFSAPGTVCKYNVLQWIPVCSVTRTWVPSAVVVVLTDILSTVVPLNRSAYAQCR